MNFDVVLLFSNDRETCPKPAVCTRGPEPIPTRIRDAMRHRQKKNTIYQVADLAGVAISTVSRVLNDSPNVSETTKRRVEEAIKELNFRPQVNARNLASRKPQMLAIAVPSFTTPFFNEVLKGVKDQIQEMDLDIIIYNTGSKNPEESVENFFDRGTADAIIAISIEVTETIDQRIKASGTPTVLVGSSHPDYDYFELDEYMGGELAGKHFGEQGFKRPAILLPSVESRASRERKQGFLDALNTFGITVEDPFFLTGDSTKHAGYTEEAGYEAIMKLHKLDEQPDAIFCLNDTQAIGALHAMDKLNIRVPEDIALMGYDNIKFTRYMDLTTIDQKMHTIGKMATQRLAQIIKDPDLPLEQTRIEPELVVRHSTQR
ncbi:MAG: LacI family DNA-binding transcriptional regulator [Balneolaceae bacterium]